MGGLTALPAKCPAAIPGWPALTQGAFAASITAMDCNDQGSADSAWHGGGSIPGMPGQPAFAERRCTPEPVPILIAVPHAGRHYPAELTGQMRDPKQSTLRLEDRLVDLLALAVARETGAGLIVAHAPRAMIDLNRASDDVDWDMIAGGAPAGMLRHAAGRRSRSGLGLVPRRLAGVGELWRRQLRPGELTERIDQVHRPYHQAIGQSLQHLRDRWGRALLLDLHSMPPLVATTASEPAAIFVVGDRFGAACEAWLAHAALDHFDGLGERVAHNRPYAGGFVLDHHGAPMRGINAMQLEICRSAYLDASLTDPGPGFAHVVGLLTGLVRRLAADLASGFGGLAQAAE